MLSLPALSPILSLFRFLSVLTIPPSKLLLLLLLHLRYALPARERALGSLTADAYCSLLPGLSFASPYILLSSLFVSPFHSVFVFQSISTDS